MNLSRKMPLHLVFILAFSFLFFPDIFSRDFSMQEIGNSPVTDSISSHQAFSENAGKSNLLPEISTYKFNLLKLSRGVLGLLVIILLAYLLSTRRRAISWRVVVFGLLLQITLAIAILQVPFVQSIFEFTGHLFVKVLDFTAEGTRFLFKSYSKGVIEAPLQTFAINILPTIIFFAALTSLLFYLGIIQKIVWVLAWIMVRLLKISGAESLSVAANIFLGQLESPLLIKAYLEKMSKSEMMLVMSGGMATMAGGVLAVYINVLGGDDPVQRILFAKHLLAASVMAAPGVVVISKIMVPQTGDISDEMHISRGKFGKNVLDAVSTGTFEGVRLAVYVGAMLLVFIAFLAMINYILQKTGQWTAINQWVAEFSKGRFDTLSLQFILGYALAPLMWLLGINTADMALVGSLLGEKLIMTEFVGYISLGRLKESGVFTDPKSVIISTYILCGFANFASVGMQIGGIGALAPGKRAMIAKLGMKALLAGTLASLLSATIVGVILS